MALWVRLVALAVFPDTESSYKSIKKGEFAIKEASGRVCLDASCALICQSGRVCTISWKWWDVIEMACGIVKQVRGGGSVECWVSGLQESVSLIASQPIGGTERYEATQGEGGENTFKRPRTAHSFHYPCILYSTRNCFSFWNVSLGLVLSRRATVRYPGFIGRFWCLMWNEVDLIWGKKESDTQVLQLSQERNEIVVCGMCDSAPCVCLRKQWKMAGNKHFWHTTAPIHIPLKGFLWISHILIPLVHI